MRKKIVIEEEKAIYRPKPKVISFPITVFETAESKEELEDWLLARNPEFIKRMRKARAEDLAGKGKSLKEIKKKLCIK